MELHQHLRGIIPINATKHESSPRPQQIIQGTRSTHALRRVSSASEALCKSSHLEKQTAPRSCSMSDLRHSRAIRALPKRRAVYDATVGNMVDPGKVVSREQRLQHIKAHHAIGAVNTRRVPDDASFRALWRRLEPILFPNDHSQDNELDGCPNSHATSADNITKAEDFDPRCGPRDFIHLTILFFLVLGSLEVMYSHLLNLSRASAQCIPSTSYIPVTYTVTSYVTPSPTSTASYDDKSLVETMTSTSTHTLTVMLSQVTSASQIAGGPYYYAVDSGSTSWLDNVAPNSGMSLVTMTTTIYVNPSSTSVLTSTLDAITVLPPPYVSTTYSVLSPDSTSTITTTQTSTNTVSEVVTLTRTRSAFTPPGTNGWNYTTAATDGDVSTSMSLGTGVPTTITGTAYWSTGTKITSTSFTTLTLTLTSIAEPTVTITSSQSLSSSAAATPPVVSSSLLEPAPSASYGSISSSDLAGPVTATTAATSLSAGDASIATITSLDVIPASYSALASSTSGPTAASGLTSSTVESIRLPPTGLSVASSVSPSIASASPPLSQGESSSSSITSSAYVQQTTSTTAIASPVSGSSLSSVLSSNVSTNSLAPTTTLSQPYPTDLSPYGSPSSSIVSSSAGASSSSTSLITSSAATTSATSSYAASSTTPSASSTASTLLSGLQTSSFALPSYTVRSPSTSASAASGLSSYAPSSSSDSGSASPIASPQSSYSTSSLLNTTPASAASTSNAASSDSTAGSVSSYIPTTASASATSITNTTSVASPTPSVCGEYGNFTLNFDDLPSFSDSHNNTDLTQAPPIFNGYHHLAFSNGYVYAPPPNDPYPPTSPPHLAVFLANASGSGLNNTPSAMAPTSGMIRPGEFGDGSSDPISAYWFDVYSAYLGCDNSGPEVCSYVFTAYAWNSAAQQEEQVAQQSATTPACPGFQNCHLEQVSFSSSFVGLSGLQIQAYKGIDEVMFFMDDVEMGWSNNTCAAGLQRLQSQRGGSGRKMRR